MKKMLFVLLATIGLSFNAFAAVNLNTATLEELESLKEVGPVKAQAIIDYRKAHGGFKTAAELDNVKGFGEKTMATLKNDISVTGTTTVAAPAANKATAKPAEKTAAMPAKMDTAVVAPATDTKVAATDAKAAKKAEKEAAKKAKADTAATPAATVKK